MKIPYNKNHKSLREQLSLLQERGLECGSEIAALQSLHDFSYYTLSAYWYPFRRMLGPGELPQTQWQFRSSEFLPGAKLSDAVALASFDRKLRTVLFEGLSRIELALRFQLAYVVGKRSPFAHVERKHLDEKSCKASAPPKFREQYTDAFEHWLSIYEQQINRSKSEDFMNHHFEKYSSEVPIWMAVEVLDFGVLVRLYSLLNRSDQNKISSCFGISNGSVFHGVLYGLSILRNHVAHHNRVWNRRLSASLRKLPTGVTDEQIAHLRSIDRQSDRRKLYPWAAMIAYCLKNYDPSTNWHRTFRTQLKKIPQNPLIEGTAEMCAPQGWEMLELWVSVPGESRITVE